MYSKTRNVNKAPVIPKISPVTLALQLLSGERLIADFHPEVTLWDILQHWEANSKLKPSLLSLASDIPVCIYLRKEISTKELLQTTTLIQLGILNGKAAIRYATKQPGVAEQPHVGGTIAPTPRAPSPEAPKRKEIENVNMENKKEETPTLVPLQVTEAHKEEEIEKVDMTNQKEKVPDLVPQEMTEAVKPESVEIVAQPQVSSDAAQKTTLVKAEVNHLLLNEEPVTTEVEVSLEESVYFLNDQGVLVYLPPKDTISTSTVHHQEEPDEFFELTEEEVRRMMNDLIYQNTQLQNAPLITAQLRREHEEKRRLQMLEKYPTTVLRIQFSDRYILQMPVPSEITLGEVKQQLLEYLELSIQVDKFELFTTPPKQVIETSSSLHQIGLTPSSLLYISSHCTLKEKFRLNPSSYAGAVRDASRRLNRSTTPSTITTATTNTGESRVNVNTKDQRPKRPASDTSTATASANKNVPKWLKMNR